MFWIIRKMTGKVVGRKVPKESLDLLLSVMPTGVYGIEDSEGNEVNVARVRNGHADFLGGADHGETD